MHCHAVATSSIGRAEVCPSPCHHRYQTMLYDNSHGQAAESSTILDSSAGIYTEGHCSLARLITESAPSYTSCTGGGAGVCYSTVVPNVYTKTRTPSAAWIPAWCRLHCPSQSKDDSIRDIGTHFVLHTLVRCSPRGLAMRSSALAVPYALAQLSDLV